jgi:hypothetical protein
MQLYPYVVVLKEELVVLEGFPSLLVPTLEE